MSLLQFIVIISAVVFAFLGVDLYKRKKVNAIHFIAFIGGLGLIILFASNVDLLNKFGNFFGARGADLLVYIALIILLYFYIQLLNHHTKDKFQLTRLISGEAILRTYDSERNAMKNIKNQTEKDDYIFNIRVYNEEKMIGKVIDDVFQAGFSKILVVNDGSRDQTLDILTKKKEQYSDKLLIIVSHTINRGGGAANQTGFHFVSTYAKELKVKWLVGFDADGQMDINDMGKFMKEIKHASEKNQKLEILLGSRFLKGIANESMPFMRRVVLKISRILTLTFYGANITDPHNGYRVIAVDTLKKLNLTADGMHYANEINESIKRNKITYKEVPVNIIYTDYSLSKGQKNSNGIKIGLEMIYKKLFFR